MAPIPPPEKYRLDQLRPGQAFYIPAHNLDWGAAVAADAQERLGRPFTARRAPPGLEIVAGEANGS
jgi:hypothetical protein